MFSRAEQNGFKFNGELFLGAVSMKHVCAIAIGAPLTPDGAGQPRDREAARR
jgi:hypothetical protein